MKGIIVEIKGKYAVALCQDGSFKKIRCRKDFRIGCETEINTSRTPFSAFHASRIPFAAKISSAAAALLLIFGFVFYVFSYNTPYYYLNIDINPSVILAANRYDIIIEATSLNDDGRKLIEKDSLKNRKIDEGVNVLISNAVADGYLKKDQQETVMLTVSGKESETAEKKVRKIETKVIRELSEDGVKAELIVEKASISEFRDAKVKGVSPGKLKLIEKARASEPGLDFEDLKDKPVAEIMKYVRTEKKNISYNKDNDDSRSKNGKKNNKNRNDKNSKTFNDKNNKAFNYTGTGNNDNDEDRRDRAGKKNNGKTSKDKTVKDKTVRENIKKAGQGGDDKDNDYRHRDNKFKDSRLNDSGKVDSRIKDNKKDSKTDKDKTGDNKIKKNNSNGNNSRIEIKSISVDRTGKPDKKTETVKTAKETNKTKTGKNNKMGQKAEKTRKGGNDRKVLTMYV